MRDVGRGPPRGKRVGDPDPGPVDRGRGAGGRKAAEELIERFGELLRGAVAFVGVLRRRGGGGDVFQGEGGGGGEGGGEGFGGEVRGEGVVGTGAVVEVLAELGVAWGECPDCQENLFSSLRQRGESGSEDGVGA